MFFIRFILLLMGILNVLAEYDSSCSEIMQFPSGFSYAAATAAYQVEGAWNEYGKSESIWDRMSHITPSRIADNSTGDIANDSHRLYKRDVEMCRELGLDFYRFSISWPRILNSSFADYINPLGVEYYNNLINELLEYNIQPIVTIYHWDLPQKLQLVGGWTNPNIVTWYADFAKVLFDLFGDRVKHWITFNEPKEICYQGYGAGTLAPGYTLTGWAEYECSRNLLLSHAKVYHLYNDNYRPTQNGSIFITLSCQWYEPNNSTSTDDIEAAEDMMTWDFGQYAHPIFIGDYPTKMKERIANRSAEQGFPRSRLPAFSDEEVEYIRGTSDYYGLNHYVAYLTYRNASLDGHYPSPSYFDDINGIYYQPAEWALDPTMPRIKTTPQYFYKLLIYLYEKYGADIFITENGYASPTGLVDDNRVTHMTKYLCGLWQAIRDGAAVVAYTPWSIMDNFEWMQGYSQRFGLYEVDYDDDNRTRTARKSAFVFKEIVRTNSLNMSYVPDNYTMTIDEGH